MSDLISRKYIIQAHKAYCEKHPNANWYKWSLSIMQTAPSVEKRGNWVHHDDESYAGGGYEECSRCGWRCSEWVFIEDNNYCPHCGAHMRGDNNG